MLTQKVTAPLTVLVVDTASLSSVTEAMVITVPGPSQPVEVSFQADPERSASSVRERLAESAGWSASVGSSIALVGARTSHVSAAGMRYVDVDARANLSLRDNNAAVLAGVFGVASSRLLT